MNKRLLQVFLLLSVIGFAQTPSQRIQNYINENKEKLNVASNETTHWQIESETSSESMGLTNYLVMQTYNGIKVDNSYIYFWIKNNEIINEPEGFINNVASKVNTSNPVLGVVEGFSSALTKLNEPVFTSSVISTDRNKYKLANGILTEDPVSAELVYFPNQSGNLVLSWSYEFYSQDAKHLWKVKIDASNGNLLEKYDLVHNCNFGPRHNHDACVGGVKTLNVASKLFKNEQTAMMLTPGTTNYRVIPFNYESPNHSSRQLITNPEATTALAPLAVAASPNGWHNTNGTIGGGTAATQFNYTRGNNVFAYSDFTNVNPANPTTYTNASAGTYPNLTFDFAYPGNGVVASTYIAAATTNLFYMNNIMHDVWYQYGFNEANRNFQAVNYGRGGAQGDAVNAEAQDASQATTPSFNNANFSTPSDGSKPRMQMYLWNEKKPLLFTVNTGTLTGTNYTVLDNGFNPGHVDLPVLPAMLTNNLVLYDDGTPDTSDACSAPINAAALSGKIAVIRRGTCSFVQKVKAAQDAGAVAAIIVNNAAGYVLMGGADATITIPAISMSQADGEALIASMALGTVNISMAQQEVFVNADGDFDNGIIAHEYTHGISTRLVGGGAGMNGSAEQPGEGWSDWAWLMMQIKAGDTGTNARGIGTFAMNQATNGPGIREYRYSTDMSVNPHTFGDTNDQWYTDTNGNDQVDVHGLGSIWAVMLWDLAWNYIGKYGYDANIYNGTGGNNKVMKLVIDAMKLTPSNPTLIQCRDAIIQADLNTTNGQDYCLIWQTFARRGMGINATSGTKIGVTGVQDQVEDFTEPTPGSTPATGSNCVLAASYFQDSDLFRIYPNPTNGDLNIAIHNYNGDLGIKVFDLKGREVYNQNVNSFNVEKSINLGNLSTGVYVLKLQGENLNYTQKIVIK
ncbi:Probable M36 fungalysin family metalloprotease precursor [Flavobacterium indicum GPTSA100-9 = DSM 17447]|uniref:Probable M36 fungalysin family metalloprotease n=1 Tax=Flavobacterium indicum (strain DSM 17447 / CIP 109464 / GPTSA100-9) TaxID=1094466 RepID=H8XR88_FLAIG|nr:T9SS-dependent M36 family metallopeptidase [Flavobacterium indicum]CCG54322.1 Probable M36 fungalysin family metalloprotease precursor [Flavobacterium indicum GPTSA100-9 = DSM 17447]